jgi:phage gp36-like protein
MATAYATRADLANLGLPAGALTGVSTAQQDAALAAAASKADGYLQDRFTLPLTAWGDDLKEAVCHVAAWTLLSSRGFNPEQGGDASVRTRFEDAIRWLEKIAAGTVTPVVTDSRTSSRAAGPRVASSTPRGW